MHKTCDVEKVILNAREERLLKYIERNELFEGDRRVNTQEFKTLDSYGMLIKYVNNAFPARCVEESTIPESNVYKVAPEVLQYWRVSWQKKKQARRESRRYWITTIIAILALVLAGISLTAQLGLIQLPAA